MIDQLSAKPQRTLRLCGEDFVTTSTAETQRTQRQRGEDIEFGLYQIKLVGDFAMQNYSGLAKEHFLNPRNVGDVTCLSVTGRAGSFTCGAAVRVSLRIDETQRIAAAGFRAAGCGFLVASASFLTDQIKGKTTGEAAALAQAPETAVLEHLGDVPAERHHCAALACQAVIAAIKSYSDSVREQWEGDEALICTCFCVSERTIEREIEQGGLRTIAEVTKACNAGGGCRSCYSLIEDILDDHLRSFNLLA